MFDVAPTRTMRFGLRFCYEAVKWVKQNRGSFDIVHAHSGYADYIMVSAQLKSQTKLPTMHAMYCPIPMKGGRWRFPVVHGKIRRWANSLDWCGGISQNVVFAMRDYGIRNVGRVRPTLNVDPHSANSTGACIRGKLGLTPEDPLVLFVGNAKPQKNAIRVVEAVHKLANAFPRIRLLITTELEHSSTDADLKSLVLAIRELDMESHVIQMGIVSDMPALMRACDVLVAPFLDTFGPSDYFMAALEAMACGKPVVASNVGGMPEIISQDVGRLVDPHDVDSMATSIGEILSDPELRKRMGRRARQLIERDFNPTKIVQEYFCVYQRLLS